MADVLRWITTHLNPDTVRSILDGITLWTAHWAEVHDPTIAKGDHDLKQEVCVTVWHALVQMHITDWKGAQSKDLVLSAVLDWLETQKKTHLKTLFREHTSSEEG